ncbi:MAG TPA: hypothetical protein VK858_10640 [Longimicrobiales bacterium]|nr:hypothetical protein [Longimicrobiales bacterium]
MPPEPASSPVAPLLPGPRRPPGPSFRRLAGLLLLAVIGCSPAAPGEPAGSTHLFLWMWDVDHDAEAFLAVVDVARGSETYGQVIGTLPAPGGSFAHHVEYELTTNELFANSFDTGRTFVFDLGDPAHPSIVAEFGDAGPFTHPHSFARTPSGTVLATYQRRADDPGVSGGLAELDDRGRLLRATSAADALDPDLRPYSLAVVPELDRVVTTSADMNGVTTGRSVQVWRLSDLALLHTVLLPPGPRGDEHLHPAEVRLLGDGESVMVGTFRCGLYVVSGLDGVPEARLARSFPWSPVRGEDTDCNVPVRFGRFWAQPVGTTGSIVVMDVSRPEEPVIVDELHFGVDARPHWLALEPGGRRMVMTGGGTLAGGAYLIDVDPETGTLHLADDLPATGSGIPGVRFDRDRWPHGDTGPAFAHGAVFGPMS